MIVLREELQAEAITALRDLESEGVTGARPKMKLALRDRARKCRTGAPRDQSVSAAMLNERGRTDLRETSPARVAQSAKQLRAS
jgi:hypothetical protein